MRRELRERRIYQPPRRPLSRIRTRTKAFQYLWLNRFRRIFSIAQTRDKNTENSNCKTPNVRRSSKFLLIIKQTIWKWWMRCMRSLLQSFRKGPIVKTSTITNLRLNRIGAIGWTRFFNRPLILNLKWICKTPANSPQTNRGS
jgi:hypothetical protein